MEEEDGRPGARAVQFGPQDAARGVFTPSLRRLHPPECARPMALPKHFRAPSWRFLCIARVGDHELRVPTYLFQIEEKNENVPGK
jgi:hypothetical protein